MNMLVVTKASDHIARRFYYALGAAIKNCDVKITSVNDALLWSVANDKNKQLVVDEYANMLDRLLIDDAPITVVDIDNIVNRLKD